jgi:hypothetical protein
MRERKRPGVFLFVVVVGGCSCVCFELLLQGVTAGTNYWEYIFLNRPSSLFAPTVV